MAYVSWFTMLTLTVRFSIYNIGTRVPILRLLGRRKNSITVDS